MVLIGRHITKLDLIDLFSKLDHNEYFPSIDAAVADHNTS